jgi:hypothetical protein
MNNIRLNSLNRIVYNTTEPSTNVSSGAFVINGGLSISNTTNSLSITSGGALSIAGGASINKDVRVGNNLYANNNVVSGTGTLGPFVMLQTQFIDVNVNNYSGYTSSNTILFTEPGNPGINGAIGNINGFGNGTLSDGSNDSMSWNYARLVMRGSSLYTGSSRSNILLTSFIVNSSSGNMYTQANFNVSDSGSDNGYTTWISPWISTTTLNTIQSIGVKAVSITSGSSTTGYVRIGPTYLQFKN